MKRYGEKYDYKHHRMNEQSLSSLETEILHEKRNIQDFALWKGRDKTSNELIFQSPWGYGRPGWHIECSAMTRLELYLFIKTILKKKKKILVEHLDLILIYILVV